MMKSLKFKLVALLLIAGCMAFSTQKATAADGATVANNVVNYIPNLVMDLLDIFAINVSSGGGYAADVRMTDLLAVGASDYDVTRYGLTGAPGEGLDPVAEDEEEAIGANLLGVDISGGDGYDPYELGLTLHVGGEDAGGGLELAASLRSALDLLTGLFLVDLEGDNWNPVSNGGGDDM